MNNYNNVNNLLIIFYILHQVYEERHYKML